MTTLLVFAGMALVTFFTRFAMIAVLGRGTVHPLLLRWLRYVPPAVLAVLVVPAALAPRGRVVLGLEAWALLAGAIVAWRTRSVLWTIVGGLAAYWVLRALGL
jgi:branched-subunit amino acid transport protein